jgi:uncharacterized membrane-anchored protein YitT (DUF2179 family)
MRPFIRLLLRKRYSFSHIWRKIRQPVIIAIGAAIAAFGYSLFQVPFNLAAGGISGVAIIINHFTNWPVGVLYLIMNIPLLTLGYFYLGRWQFLIYTMLAVFIFSLATDLFIASFPLILTQYPITKDILLSTIYAGLVSGIGVGIVYRAGGTLGGTGIVGRIIQQKTGIPLSQIYLYTDGIIILAAGFVFGWETALHALLTLFLNGLASDFALEGPSTVRTVVIVTDHPEELSKALMEGLHRGVSRWQVTGGYTNQPHFIVWCAVYRPQVIEMKRIVASVDPKAFVVIGNAHQALGSGFIPLKR